MRRGNVIRVLADSICEGNFQGIREAFLRICERKRSDRSKRVLRRSTLSVIIDSYNSTIRVCAVLRATVLRCRMVAECQKEESMKDLHELETACGYSFQNKQLLRQAMTHSSYANEHRSQHMKDNERLEFLGDAVLEVISSEFLFREYPDMPEGDLTKLRASIVCEPTLALCARELNLGTYLHLGKGEERTGGRGRDSIVSDAMEALIGAIYLDGGFANAKEFVHRFIMTDIEHKKLFYDSKTILQEIVQRDRKGAEISYHLIGEEGPDHNKRFVVDLLIGGKMEGRGHGRTKKAAEQEAAYQTILKLNGKGIQVGHVPKEH